MVEGGLDGWVSHWKWHQLLVQVIWERMHQDWNLYWCWIIKSKSNNNILWRLPLLKIEIYFVHYFLVCFLPLMIILEYFIFQNKLVSKDQSVLKQKNEILELNNNVWFWQGHAHMNRWSLKYLVLFWEYLKNIYFTNWIPMLKVDKTIIELPRLMSLLDGNFP